jgi:predicted TIM-barrel fold metal-dependent hydrolase
VESEYDEGDLEQVRTRIEAFVESYGAGRMLFGTGFPKWDHGGMMLTLKHAEIAEEDKQTIAAGNLERILAEERL